MELEGTAELDAALRRIIADAAAAADAANAENAADLLGRAMQLTPYEEGDLEGSGDIRPLGDGGYEVGFYGQGIKALVQHERVDFHHPIKGQAKFLEAPFAENLDTYLANIGDAVKRSLR